MHHLGALTVLIKKAPTADLEEDQPHLVALGITYNQIGAFLEGKLLAKEIEEKLITIYLRTQYKRWPTPTIYDDEI